MCVCVCVWLFPFLGADCHPTTLTICGICGVWCGVVWCGYLLLSFAVDYLQVKALFRKLALSLPPNTTSGSAPTTDSAVTNVTAARTLTLAVFSHSLSPCRLALT